MRINLIMAALCIMIGLTALRCTPQAPGDTVPPDIQPNRKYARFAGTWVNNNRINGSIYSTKTLVLTSGDSTWAFAETTLADGLQINAASGIYDTADGSIIRLFQAPEQSDYHFSFDAGMGVVFLKNISSGSDFLSTGFTISAQFTKQVGY